MWPFKKQTVDYQSKAATMADLLLGVAPEATRIIAEGLLTEELGVDKDIPTGSQAILTSLAWEVLAFELHLTDRQIFSSLGASTRAPFMDALCAAIAQRLGPPRDVELQNVYNKRQQFYRRFPKLYAESGESLKGTLFWEFGKMLAAAYAESNPAAIMAISISGMSLFES